MGRGPASVLLIPEPEPFPSLRMALVSLDWPAALSGASGKAGLHAGSWLHLLGKLRLEADSSPWLPHDFGLGGPYSYQGYADVLIHIVKSVSLVSFQRSCWTGCMSAADILHIGETLYFHVIVVPSDVSPLEAVMAVRSPHWMPGPLANGRAGSWGNRTGTVWRARCLSFFLSGNGGCDISQVGFWPSLSSPVRRRWTASGLCF